MITNAEVNQITAFVQKAVPGAEYIDQGHDGVVFQVDEAVLKVFAEPEKAGRELAGFNAIRAINENFAPTIFMSGRMGDYAAILREDILDAGAPSGETAQDFAHLVKVIAPDLAKRINTGGDADALIGETYGRFIDDHCIEDDSDVFSRELLAFVVGMIRNDTPIDDFHIDNIGLAASDWRVCIRDMSRFTGSEPIPIVEPIGLVASPASPPITMAPAPVQSVPARPGISPVQPGML